MQHLAYNSLKPSRGVLPRVCKHASSISSKQANHLHRLISLTPCGAIRHARPRICHSKTLTRAEPSGPKSNGKESEGPEQKSEAEGDKESQARLDSNGETAKDNIDNLSNPTSISNSSELSVASDRSGLTSFEGKAEQGTQKHDNQTEDDNRRLQSSQAETSENGLENGVERLQKLDSGGYKLNPLAEIPEKKDENGTSASGNSAEFSR